MKLEKGNIEDKQYDIFFQTSRYHVTVYRIKLFVTVF